MHTKTYHVIDLFIMKIILIIIFYLLILTSIDLYDNTSYFVQYI